MEIAIIAFFIAILVGAGLFNPFERVVLVSEEAKTRRR